MKTIEQMYNEAKALVEDRTYQIGEISEKTGLQKTANGWVKPKNQNNTSNSEQEEKWKSTKNEFGRERITMKTRQGGTVHIYESENPKQKNARFKVDTGSHTNTFNTMEEAKAFAEKHYGNESKKGTSTKKEENKSASGKPSPNKTNKKENTVFNVVEEIGEKQFRKNLQKYEDGVDWSHMSLNEIDQELKNYNIDPHTFNYKTRDNACRITADTKIKLSNITKDAKFEEGHVSHRKNGDFVKQGGKWIPVKNSKTEVKEQTKETSNKNQKGTRPSQELVEKRLKRAEKRKANASNAPTLQKKETVKTESIKWENHPNQKDSEIAHHNGNNLVITRHYDGGYTWRIGTHVWYPTARGEAKSREEAVKQATEASKKYPGVITAEGIEWKRSPAGENRTNIFVGADNGNIMRISYNDYDDIYDYRVYEEGRDQNGTFKAGKAKTLEEAMKETKKASDNHTHSGTRPIRIPYGAVFGNKTKWDNEDMYASKPRNVKK